VRGAAQLLAKLDQRSAALRQPLVASVTDILYVRILLERVSFLARRLSEIEATRTGIQSPNEIHGPNTCDLASLVVLSLSGCGRVKDEALNVLPD
jgi:hypothetical protein